MNCNCFQQFGIELPPLNYISSTLCLVQWNQVICTFSLINCNSITEKDDTKMKIEVEIERKRERSKELKKKKKERDRIFPHSNKNLTSITSRGKTKTKTKTHE